VCGACTVILDDVAVRACLMFAIQAQGKRIRTVEGLADGDKLHPLQSAFIKHHGLQCGFCTPGFLMLAVNVLEREPHIGDEDSWTCCRPIFAAARLSEHHQGGARRGRRHAPRRSRGMSHGYPAPPRAEERRVLGHPVPRIEDRPLVTGHGLYAGDVSFPHQLHMRIVRSAHAHARILSIDTAAARALPGVVAVWTVDDIADLPPIDFRDPSAEALKPYRQPVLARGRCAMSAIRWRRCSPRSLRRGGCRRSGRHRGRAAAGAVCRRKELGEFDDGRASEPTIVRHSFGDIDAAFADAHAVVELDLTIGRHSGVPMETRAPSAATTRRATCWSWHGAAKVPHRNKDTLVRMLGRSPHSLHLFEGHTAAASGFAASFTPKTCWCWWRRCASAGR